MTTEPVKCPYCGVIFRPGKPMQHHLRDAHSLSGMKAHIIANPKDRQAARTITGRRARSAPKRILVSPKAVDDCILIEEIPHD